MCIFLLVYHMVLLVDEMLIQWTFDLAYVGQAGSTMLGRAAAHIGVLTAVPVEFCPELGWKHRQMGIV